MQIIVEVEVEAGVYASEQYQSRIKAPSVCPNCGIAQSLEAQEDIELRRNDEAFLDGLGAQRIPDPTTSGDFTRRFNETLF